MCMTHGHELKRGIAGGKGGTEQSGAKGKNWDNCNSIINKIYLKIIIPSERIQTKIVCLYNSMFT